jgi:hypothetical protein
LTSVKTREKAMRHVTPCCPELTCGGVAAERGT